MTTVITKKCISIHVSKWNQFSFCCPCFCCLNSIEPVHAWIKRWIWCSSWLSSVLDIFFSPETTHPNKTAKTSPSNWQPINGFFCCCCCSSLVEVQHSFWSRQNEPSKPPLRLWRAVWVSTMWLPPSCGAHPADNPDYHNCCHLYLIIHKFSWINHWKMISKKSLWHWQCE